MKTYTCKRDLSSMPQFVSVLFLATLLKACLHLSKFNPHWSHTLLATEWAGSNRERDALIVTWQTHLLRTANSASYMYIIFCCCCSCSCTLVQKKANRLAREQLIQQAIRRRNRLERARKLWRYAKSTIVVQFCQTTGYSLVYHLLPNNSVQVTLDIVSTANM